MNNYLLLSITKNKNAMLPKKIWLKPENGNAYSKNVDI